MITRVSIEATEQQFLVNSTSLGRPNYQQLSIQYRVSPFFSFVVVLKQFCRVVCCLRAESCSAFFLVVCRVELRCVCFRGFNLSLGCLVMSLLLCCVFDLVLGVVLSSASVNLFPWSQPAFLPVHGAAKVYSQFDDGTVAVRIQFIC